MRELRKSSDRMLAGVAGGMAEYFKMDKTLMRVIWVLGSFVIWPAPLAYLILALVMPDAPREQTPEPPKRQPDVIEMERQGGSAERPEFTPKSGRRRLTKSHDRWISGVAAGVAEYFDIDPILVRALFLVAVFAGYGSGLVLYIILAIVLPYPDYRNR